MSESYPEENSIPPVFEIDEDTASPTEDVGRPEYIPGKFWDAEAGNTRVEALANSYAELERKLSGGIQNPQEFEYDVITDTPVDDELNPIAPYDIDTSHGAFDRSPEIDSLLQEAGLSQDQAQLVYDLAAHVLMPAVSEMANGQTVDAEESRLQAHFGGVERWQEVRRQLSNWGKRHLSEDAFDALSSTHDGVLWLYRLMHAEEPSMLRGESVVESTDEGSLRKIIRDPRYWRDRDTSLVRRVSEGFRRLYPDGS